MNDVVFYVVTFLFRIISFLFVARFLLQACRVDFYNPLAQGFIKATDPVLQPLRKLLPGYRNLDIASLLAAILADVIMIFAIGALADQMMGTFLQILVSAIIAVALLIVRIFWWSILIVIVASFVAQGSYHPALNLLQQITEPILAPARRLLPAMGGLDFSPILVFLALGVVERILQQVKRKITSDYDTCSHRFSRHCRGAIVPQQRTVVPARWGRAAVSRTLR